MKRLTIGYFVDSFFPMIDGVAMVVDNYAKRLSKVADVIVFAPKPVKGDYDDRIFPYKVVRCNSLSLPYIDYNLPTPKIDPGFIKELNKYKLDVVHIHSPATLGQIGVKYAKKNNTLLIGTLHSQYKQDIMRTVKSERITNILLKNVVHVFNQCDEVWTVNKKLIEVFKEDYHYKKVPRIIPNATDMLPVKDISEAKNIINKNYNIKQTDKVLLFVGRLNKLKNIMFIVDSLVELNKLKLNYNYKMIFVGSGQDEKELKKYVFKNNLDDKVIFTGRVEDRDELARFYVRSDLFLFPSWYDTNSIVQIEAASQKTPTVFIEGTVTSSTITNNFNGFTTPNSAYEYAKRIDEVLNDNELLQNVSENAFKTVYKTWDNVVEEIYALYNQLLENKFKE